MELDFGLKKGQEFVDGEEGFAMDSKPLMRLFMSLGEEMDKELGLEAGMNGEDNGVGGVLEEESPSWVLAWRMRLCKRFSGPKAKRIISFSP